MYDQFYGFSGRPFQLTPDARFYFESGTHRKAMSYLGYGLAQGEGFIVITGEIGSGKSTLVAHLMDTIDKGRLNAVKLVSTRVEGDDLLRLVAQQFELPSEGVSKAELLQTIEFYLHDQARQGKRSLLIVDEAQNLAEGALEELRMLSNFQLGGHPLLQIFLLGQPEFRAMVQYSPYLEQLRQRVIATHHLTAMEPEEIEPYVLHRLSKVGWKGDPTFTADAYDEMFEFSEGIPRKLNALASRVLLLGALEGLHAFNGDDVRAVVSDMVGETEDYEDPLDLQVEFDDEDVGHNSLLATKSKRSSGPVLANVIGENGHIDFNEDDYDEEYYNNAGDLEPFVEPRPSKSAAFPTLEADKDLADGAEVEPAIEAMIAADEPLSASVIDAGDAAPLAPSVVSVAPEITRDMLNQQQEEMDEMARQMAELQSRLAEQDVALRKVLTLLVNWVEADEADGDMVSAA